MRLINLKRMTQKRLFLSLLCLFILAACTSSQGSDPSAAVVDYLNAMIKDDTAKLPQLICSDYEAGAKTDFDSFGALSGVSLNGLSCSTTSTSGGTATVACKGSIDFTYNGEQNSNDLSSNTYSVKQVDGEWKMCGYK